MKTLYGDKTSEKYNTEFNFLESIGVQLRPKDFIILGSKKSTGIQKRKVHKKTKLRNEVSQNKQTFRGTYFSDS